MKKFIGLALLAPSFVFAATTVNLIISKIGDIINKIIPLLFALAFLWFIWNIVKYIEAGADVKKKDETRESIIFTIILLFIAVSVWGIIKVVQESIGVRGEAAPKIYAPDASQ